MTGDGILTLLDVIVAVEDEQQRANRSHPPSKMR